MTSRIDALGKAAGLVLVGFLTLAGLGCDRSHLTSSYARSFHTAFAAQTVNPDRRVEAKAVLGLDSQEASIIAGTDRKQLSPAAESAAQTQLLTYSNRAGGREASSMPPPSVGPGN